MDSFKIDELVRSLQAFKLNLDGSKKVKYKGENIMALQVTDEVLIPKASTSRRTSREENKKQIKQVEAKESLLTEELNNLVNTKKELVEMKLILEKFNVGSIKLDEFLYFGKRELGRGGQCFLNKGKVVFVKASN
ncbi:hypothetical protein J1N35_018682 [Gossypium stocksii]|uniref:Uncharacterized protein n=1 Tax=Gossypium stocksii TaxID=47602 RepID=A0A9D3VR01_9ROSI|nr:hypothetical protein J1N35_018682 [Gossypium stocksii]